MKRSAVTVSNASDFRVAGGSTGGTGTSTELQSIFTIGRRSLAAIGDTSLAKSGRFSDFKGRVTFERATLTSCSNSVRNTCGPTVTFERKKVRGRLNVFQCLVLELDVQCSFYEPGQTMLAACQFEQSSGNFVQ